MTLQLYDVYFSAPPPQYSYPPPPHSFENPGAATVNGQVG